MKSAIFSLLATSALAAEVFQLKATPKSQAHDGGLIASLHEGAGINYAFSNSPFGPSNFQINDTSVLAWVDSGDFPNAAFIDTTQATAPLELGILTPPESAGWQTGYSFKSGKLAFDGDTESFYSCANFTGPYPYTWDLIAWSKEAPEESEQCEPIWLEKSL